MTKLLLAALTFILPLPPTAQDDALELAKPYTAGASIAGPWHLAQVVLGPTTLQYRIGRPGQEPAVAVRVDLEALPRPTAAIEQLSEDVAADELAAADNAARLLYERIEERLDSGEVEVRRLSGSSPAGGSPCRASSDGLPDEELRDASGSAEYLASRAALILLLVGLALAWRRHRAALGEVPRWAWVSVATVTAVSALAAALLPDVVAYQNGLGHEHARFVAEATAGPFPASNSFGAMQVEVARILGFFAPLGREPFFASRVAMIAAPLLLFLLAQALTRRPAVAVTAAVLMALMPAWLFIACSGSATAPGVMLMLTAGWLTVSAARTRDRWLLVLAALALVILARYRLVGPLVAIPTALLFFAVRGNAEAQASGAARRWWWCTALLALAGAAAALPHMLVQLRHASGLAAHASADAPAVGLLSEPGWLPPAATVIAGAGLAVALIARSWLGAVLSLLIVGVLAGTTQSLDRWVNVARYQAWALPAMALAGGLLFAALRSSLPKAFPLVVTPLVVWLGYGVAVASVALSEPSLATRQLHLWRESLDSLPARAVLVVPLEPVGDAAASLPDAELEGARPDIRLISFRDYEANAEHLVGRPLFWWHPLYCHARSLHLGPNAAADCLTGPASLQLEPRLVRSVTTNPPEPLREVGVSRTTWVPVPYPEAKVEIGLYRIAPMDVVPTDR